MGAAVRDSETATERLLINRNFALLWAGQTLSVLGDFVFQTTLVVWIASELAPDRSWTPLAVSGLLVASTAPILLIGPVAGVLVDRWRDKRAVMVRANLASALLVLALVPATDLVRMPGIGGSLPLAWQLGAIFAVVFAVNVVGQFFGPAAAVTLRDVVPESDIARATSRNQTSTSLALLVGPPLAAPLLFAFGAQWALLINAGSFLVAMLTAHALRLPASSEQPIAAAAEQKFLSAFMEGLRFFRRSRTLVVLAVSIVIVVFGVGALNTLDVFFVTRNLGASATYYGVLGAAEGCGMLLGSVLAGMVAERVRLERMIWGSLALGGLIIIVYARTTSLVSGALAIFLLGLVIPAVNVSIGPLMLRVTPREFVGRVSATIRPLQNASSILGMLLAGALYGTSFRGFGGRVLGVQVGPLDTIFTGVGLLCLIGAAFARANLDCDRGAHAASG
ncbi:MAG TPA: MFS transporter [Thermomicrobiales bacterium]